MKRSINPHDCLKQRLDDWGAWRRDMAYVLGWNANVLDFDAEVPHGIQGRNDTYSDPVVAEYQRMTYEYRRHMTTDAAVHEMKPRHLRMLIVARHVAYPNISERQLADKIGMNHRYIGNDIKLSYNQLLEILAGLKRQGWNVAGKKYPQETCIVSAKRV